MSSGRDPCPTDSLQANHAAAEAMNQKGSAKDGPNFLYDERLRQWIEVDDARYEENLQLADNWANYGPIIYREVPPWAPGRLAEPHHRTGQRRRRRHTQHNTRAPPSRVPVVRQPSRNLSISIQTPPTSNTTSALPIDFLKDSPDLYAAKASPTPRKRKSITKSRPAKLISAGSKLPPEPRTPPRGAVHWRGLSPEPIRARKRARLNLPRPSSVMQKEFKPQNQLMEAQRQYMAWNAMHYQRAVAAYAQQTAAQTAARTMSSVPVHVGRRC